MLAGLLETGKLQQEPRSWKCALRYSAELEMIND